MALALFDLDNTLLAGDSDYLWGRYLAASGLVDAAAYERANAAFYADYAAGTLDIDAFLRFSLEPLRQHPRPRLEALREDFLRDCIDPIILPAARALVERHRARGDTLIMITATNAFVTAPIAARFGIAHLIATEPAEADGRFTGDWVGIPTFREGKVQRLRAWLEAHPAELAHSTGYSDSHNDLPLLETVDRPVAVDPDPILERTARQRGWSILSLRESS